jgi:hypothetical protein
MCNVTSSRLTLTGMISLSSCTNKGARIRIEWEAEVRRNLLTFKGDPPPFTAELDGRERSRPLFFEGASSENRNQPNVARLRVFNVPWRHGGDTSPV